MTFEPTTKVPAIDELHELIKSKFADKYTCDLVQDRWNFNFSARKCVVIKKSATVGVGIFINEKKNKVEVDGIVPNMILERVFFRNVIGRLFLIPSWNKLATEVGDVLKTRLS